MFHGGAWSTGLRGKKDCFLELEVAAEGVGIIPEGLGHAQPDWDSFSSLTSPSSRHSGSPTAGPVSPLPAIRWA